MKVTTGIVVDGKVVVEGRPCIPGEKPLTDSTARILEAVEEGPMAASSASMPPPSDRPMPRGFIG